MILNNNNNNSSTYLYIILFITHIYFTYSGIITPYSDTPVYNTVANKGEIADYTFFFVCETTIPAGGTLNVLFPSQYVSGLGIIQEPTCSFPCAIEGNLVIFTFSTTVLNGVASNVTIQGVTNPSNRGGTGNFQLYSMKGNNILDQNLIFGILGIADTIGKLTSTTVALDSSGTSMAGSITTYAFSFKVPSNIPWNSYFMFTLHDTGFSISTFPSCAAFAINGIIIEGTLSCQSFGQKIKITGLTGDILAGTSVGISVTVTNPTVSGITQPFDIAIYRNATNVIYAEKLNIPGVPITAGPITNIALTPVLSSAIQARGKSMDYQLTFLPKNSLATGTVIVITFPSVFTIDTSAYQNYYIVSGLDDVTPENPVGMAIIGNSFVISYYAAYPVPEQIAIQTRMVNPTTSGVTTSVKISTYTDVFQTIVIDENFVDATTSISSIGSPLAHQILTTPSTPIANSQNVNIEFRITPSITIPINGQIQILIPDGFSFGTIDTTKCQVYNRGAGIWMNSPSCTTTGSFITLSILSTETFPLGTDSGFRIINTIVSPKYNGTYLFDINTYSNDGVTMIESYSDFVIVLPNPFIASNPVTVLDLERTKRTLIIISINTLLPLPTGKTQQTANDIQGFFEFVFIPTGTDTWNIDLGTGIDDKGTYPCQAIAGLVPLDGGDVTCTLYHGDFTNPISPVYPTIKVTNFQPIDSNEVITVHLPNILISATLATGFTINIKAIKLQSRIRTELNSISSTFTTLAPITITPTASSNALAYTFLSMEVSTPTALTLDTGLASDIPANSYIIVSFPFYDVGWVPQKGTTCAVQAVPVECQPYPGVDWILIYTSTLISSTTQNIWSFYSLQVPSYYKTGLTGIKIRVISATSFYELYVINEPNFPALTVPTLLVSIILAPIRGTGYVNCPYTFIFQAKNAIAAGSIITITFPTNYNLLASYPPVSYYSPQLSSISSSLPLKFIPTSVQTLTISNFNTIPAQNTFNVEVIGLRNPSTGTSSTGWTISIQYNGYDVTNDANFDSFSYTSAFQSGTVIFDSITAFPSNAYKYATYTFSFIPRTPIPAYGQILITFPNNQYGSLPNPPICSISGSITTFLSCETEGTTVIITMDTSFSSGELIFIIQNIQNPGVGTTSPFIIRTYYDGVYLDQTDSNSIFGRTVNITSASSNISVFDLSFTPQNEGEPSTYTLSFLPTNTLNLNMNILIIFPSVYDNNLGSNVYCIVIAGLTGTVTCTVSNKIVYISGFQYYEPNADNPIALSIFNIYNPNRDINSNTGQFQIATLVTNTYVYIDHNDYVGALTILPAPGWCTLYNVTGNNYNTRITSNYSLNFTTNIQIPTLIQQGQIFIQFPSQFDIPDGISKCTTPTTSFSQALTCSISKNIVSITGNANPFNGNLILNVLNIANPVDEGSTGRINIKTYDGFQNIILERSFDNLDPFSFYYTYPGPLILVNDNEDIIVQRGTQTPTLYITVDYPCALNLTIKSTAPGFSIIPYNIPLVLGQLQTPFVVSVPENFATGSYYIEWETVGDSISYYTPLKKTRVNITTDSNIIVSVPTVYDIPYGGNSLPSTLIVPYAPDIGFEVSLNFFSNYPGISVDKSSAVFSSGISQVDFIVTSTNDTTITGGLIPTGGTLQLSVSGTNSDIYSLSSTSIIFNVISSDWTQPDITQLAVTDITQTTVLLTIGTSQTCMAYYMIALLGTSTPLIDEVKNQGPATYNTTSSTYGKTLVPLPSNMVSIKLDGLVAQTSYTVFVYVISRGEIISDVKTCDFKTSNRYPAADFSLRFNQAYLNSAEKSNIIQAVAFVVSLHPQKIMERKYIVQVVTSSRLLTNDTNQSSSSNSTTLSTIYDNNITSVNYASNIDNDNTLITFQNDIYDDNTVNSSSSSRDLQTATTMIYLQMMTTPESAIYSSPTIMANSLNDRRNQLADLLSNFDTTWTITAVPYTSYYPAFVNPPVIANLSITWVSFTAELNNYGWIFGVCIKASEDLGKPTAYQVYRGFNGTNVAVSHGSIEVSQPYETFALNITNLDPKTEYNAYLVGGSAQPGYPDLMPDSSVQILSFETLPAPVIPKLNINIGNKLSTSNWIIIFMLPIHLFWLFN